MGQESSLNKEYNYQDLLKYRTHTDAFNVNFANNGIFGIVQGGPTRAVADGFYILTQPLAKGTYPIHYKSSLICTQPDWYTPNYAQDITYTIIAQQTFDVDIQNLDVSRF